jgi:hypothetical protein
MQAHHPALKAPVRQVCRAVGTVNLIEHNLDTRPDSAHGSPLLFVLLEY